MQVAVAAQDLLPSRSGLVADDQGARIGPAKAGNIRTPALTALVALEITLQTSSVRHAGGYQVGWDISGWWVALTRSFLFLQGRQSREGRPRLTMVKDTKALAKESQRETELEGWTFEHHVCQGWCNGSICLSVCGLV